MTNPHPLSRAAEAYAFAFCATLKHGQDAHMLAAQTGFLAGAQFVLESAEVKALVSALEKISNIFPSEIIQVKATWAEDDDKALLAQAMLNEIPLTARTALQHFRALAGGESK